MNAAEFDLCVAGGGVAALTAAWHAALNGARVMVFAGGDLPGGLVANIGVLEGFPAVSPTSGMALAERLAADAEALGASVERSEAEAVTMAGGSGDDTYEQLGGSSVVQELADQGMDTVRLWFRKS